MNNVDKEYFRLLNTVLTNGKRKKNRTGVDTVGVFGEQAKFDINLDAFPILTTKKVFFKGILHELLWFIKGDTNIKYLVDNDVHIWDEWAYKRYYEIMRESHLNSGANGTFTYYSQEEFIRYIKESDTFAKKWGELGEGTYGGMWRAFPAFNDRIAMPNRIYVDQLQKVIDKLKSNPDDRRMIVSAWHPYWVDYCCLPPCHVMYHFNTEELTVDERWDLLLKIDAGKSGWYKEGADANSLTRILDDFNIPKRRLNCLLYQRSCDLGLGVPFNITSYCLLTTLVAHSVNMVPGIFTHTYGDLHIYENHYDQLKLQLTREPMKLPKLWLNPEVKDLFSFKFEDIKLIDYVSHSAIKMEVAV